MGLTIKFESSLKQLTSRLDKLSGTVVEVGFFEEDRYGPENSNLPVATVAAYNEFGTTYNPQRPFMSDAFSSTGNQAIMAKLMKDVYISTMLGGSAAQRLLNILGSTTGDMIQISIAQYAAMGGNSSSTIKKKGGRDTPLIDTGKMLESVRFHIHK